jgi:hypothetical protein
MYIYKYTHTHTHTHHTHTHTHTKSTRARTKSTLQPSRILGAAEKNPRRLPRRPSSRSSSPKASAERVQTRGSDLRTNQLRQTAQLWDRQYRHSMPRSPACARGTCLPRRLLCSPPTDAGQLDIARASRACVNGDGCSHGGVLGGRSSRRGVLVFSSAPSSPHFCCPFSSLDMQALPKHRGGARRRRPLLRQLQQPRSGRMPPQGAYLLIVLRVEDYHAVAGKAQAGCKFGPVRRVG